MSSRVWKTACFGLLTALAFVFSYLESLISLNIGIPGIKIGLANLVVVAALYLFPVKYAFFIAVIRIILSGFTFGGISAMLFSLAGGILSFAVMAVLKKTNRFSVTGVSVAGGIAHNAGQIIAAAFVTKTAQIIYYIPVLVISGTAAGFLIGIISGIIINRLEKVIKND